MTKEVKLPRMARIPWVRKFDRYVFLKKAYLVLDQTLADALVDAMVEEAFWRQTDSAPEGQEERP